MSSTIPSAEQTQSNHPPNPSIHPLPPHLASILSSTHLHYLTHALSLAELSPPKPTNFRVSAVLVSFSSSSSSITQDALPHSTNSDRPSTAGEETQKVGVRDSEGEEEQRKGRVGGTILATGYTLELQGNTHAEQCCLLKLAEMHDLPESRVGEVLKPSPSPSPSPSLPHPQPTSTPSTPSTSTSTIVLYTTMEPCTHRLSGNISCVERILATKDAQGRQAIDMVVVGVGEPDTFVKVNEGRRRLEEAGVRVLKMEGEEAQGLEERILRVARAGHVEGRA